MNFVLPIQAVERPGSLPKRGNTMEDLANPAEPIKGSQKFPAIAIIENQVIARTRLVNILKRELTGSEIVEMAEARQCILPLRG